VTGQAAMALLAEQDRLLLDAAAALKVNPAELPERLAAMVEDRRRLERQVTDLQRKLATGAAAPQSEQVGDVKFSARNLGEVPPRELKGLAEAIGQQQGGGVVVLVSTAEGKASVVVGVAADLTARVSAVDLVRAAATVLGGKGGGGRPDMAQAGGPDATAADAALDAIRAALAAVARS